MIVSYQYLTWSPPYLTDEEELEFGRQIAVRGRENFVAEFRKSMFRHNGQPKRPPAAPVATFFSGLVFIGAMWLIISEGKISYIAVPVGIFFCFATAIYLVSAYITTRKFEKWIDRLIAKYAAHAARGGK